MGNILLPYAISTGTGATDLGNWVDDYEELMVETRFGTVYIQKCRKGGATFWHINRHCATRPLEENAYRLAHLIQHSTRCAYILALGLNGVKRIQAISCVGSAEQDVMIKDVVFPDQYLTPTFCPLSFSDLMPDESGPEFYREWLHPFNQLQRTTFAKKCREAGLTIHENGLLDIVPGPQFETIADMRDKRERKVTIVGMATALPESPLAGELGISHQPACISTDHPDQGATQSDIEAVAREISPAVFQAAFESLLTIHEEDNHLLIDSVPPVEGLRKRLGLPI